MTNEPNYSAKFVIDVVFLTAYLAWCIGSFVALVWLPLPTTPREAVTWIDVAKLSAVLTFPAYFGYCAGKDSP